LLGVAPMVPTPEGVTQREALAGMIADAFLREKAGVDIFGFPIELNGNEQGIDLLSGQTLRALGQFACSYGRGVRLNAAFLGYHEDYP
jgi:hypothetical protein